MRRLVVVALLAAQLAQAAVDQPWRDPVESAPFVWWVVPLFLAGFAAFAWAADKRRWILPALVIGVFIVWPVVSCMSR